MNRNHRSLTLPADFGKPPKDNTWPFWATALASGLMIVGMVGIGLAVFL